MSSLGPWHGGRRGGGGGDSWGTPFSSDVWQWGHGDYGGAMTGWRRGGGGIGMMTSEPPSPMLTSIGAKQRAHIFLADLLGVTKEDLKVQVEDNNILHISGDTNVEEEERNDKWHMVERRRGTFSRRFRLPENADLDGINCGLEHGVLTVEVPKKDVQEQSKNVRFIDVA